MGVPKLLSAVLIVTSLAACETPMQPTTGPVVPTPQANALQVDVADVQVLQAFDSSSWAAAEQAFASRMVDGMRTWAGARMVPVGRSGTVKLIVQNASIGERVQRVQTGPVSMERVAVYDGILDLRVEAVDRQTMRTGFADATVRRQRTAPVGTPPYERDRIWSEMATEMLSEVDAALPVEIQRRMPQMVLY